MLVLDDKEPSAMIQIVNRHLSYLLLLALSSVSTVSLWVELGNSTTEICPPTFLLRANLARISLLNEPNNRRSSNFDARGQHSVDSGH